MSDWSADDAQCESVRGSYYAYEERMSMKTDTSTETTTKALWDALSDIVENPENVIDSQERVAALDAIDLAFRQSTRRVVFIAIVDQPAVSNVFLVEDELRTRLIQNTHEYCLGYANAMYYHATEYELRAFRCGTGDAAIMQWEQV
jgi:hypothetical protein